MTMDTATADSSEYSAMDNICAQVIDGLIKPADAADQLRTVAAEKQSDVMGQLLMDVLCLYDTDVQSAVETYNNMFTSENTKYQLTLKKKAKLKTADVKEEPTAEAAEDEDRANLKAVEQKVAATEERCVRLRQLCQNIGDLIPPELMRLSLDSLKENDEQRRAAMRPMAVTRTRIYYKQSKYNLYREESEGYGKAITELLEETDAKRMLQKLRCLIGQFNLDPNRMLDVVLECFECCLDRATFFCALLKLYDAPTADICAFISFKLSFYQEPTNTIIPISLYKLIGQLVVSNLLDIAVIACYLSPSQQGCCDDHKDRDEAARKVAAKPQTVGVTTIALDAPRDSASTSAAGQSIAAMPPSMPLEDGQNENHILAVNQKLGVLCALLELKSWTHAKWLLSRLPDVYPFVHCPRLVKALADMCIDATQVLYLLYCPEYILTCAEVDVEQLAMEQGEVDLLTEWQTFTEDVFTWLHCLGFLLGRQPAAYNRVVRLLTVLAKYKLADSLDVCPRPNTADWPTRMAPQTEEIKQLAVTVYPKIIDVCDDCLLPGLIVSGGNSYLSDQLWLLFGQFPYDVRYRLYGRLSTHIRRHAQLQYKEKQVMARTRYVMKRLSKETTKMAGRQLGKLAHVHAATVFDHLLSQVQVFDNFIPSVVDSLRFLTTLEFDILSYCIIEHLASPDKQKLKANDASISPWLQSLSTFVGMAFKRYNMELTGVLQYVANELKDGNCFDLLVLKEIITTMSGVETTTSLTDDQLQAQSGGDVLKQEEGRFGDTSRNVKKTVNRLRDALLQEEHLVISLCILTAQQRGAIAFKQEQHKIYLKLVSSMLDQCQETLVQFGIFLSTNLKPDDYANRMPSAPALITEYRLPLDAAMFLSRPIYKHRIQTKYESLKKRERAAKKQLDDERKYQLFSEAFDSVARTLADDLQRALTETMPAHSIAYPLLITVFWLLETYDLDTPVAAYERAIERIHKAAAVVDNDRTMNDKLRRKERDRLNQLASKLSDERRRQTTHVRHVMKHLESLVTDMCGKKVRDRHKVVSDFLQMCMIPRALFGEVDATYCTKFFFAFHRLRPLTFPTVIIIDRLFADLTGLLAGLTENEANCLGRLVGLVMQQTLKWYNDENLFNEECNTTPGFVKQLNRVSKDDTADTLITYSVYKMISYKWQTSLHKMVQVVLSSMQYLPIRNTLFILIKVLSSYPIVIEHKKQVEQRVNTLRETEKDKREDLYVLANSYWTHLHVRKEPKLIAAREMNPQIPAARQPKPSAEPATSEKPAADKEKQSSASGSEASPNRKRPSSPAKAADPAPSKLVKVTNQRSTLVVGKVKVHSTRKDLGVARCLFRKTIRSTVMINDVEETNTATITRTISNSSTAKSMSNGTGAVKSDPKPVEPSSRASRDSSSGKTSKDPSPRRSKPSASSDAMVEMLMEQARKAAAATSSTETPRTVVQTAAPAPARQVITTARATSKPAEELDVKPAIKEKKRTGDKHENGEEKTKKARITMDGVADGDAKDHHKKRKSSKDTDRPKKEHKSKKRDRSSARSSSKSRDR